ncbi:MAG: oligosaccharide flippase family protein [Gammaproteobacteria bacterium]|nr:oligosaccharide flippase family protein [Gammaproteobacteria bacterium]MBU1647632.1 oligosaccharide flippase family protein [Gammaproteobacteria bacterium]MBU1971520.1 oligosaccharide flippase family protein [Gammaproteobacteria bacterium]
MLKRNISANFLASVWAAGIGIAFVPLYIKYLGMESYGLIGVLAALQAWSTALDFGLAPTINRQVARLRAGGADVQDVHNLLRSFEWLAGGIAGAICMVLWAASGWLASHWIKLEALPLETASQALALIAAVVATRWLSGLYRGGLMGMELQVWLSSYASVFVTLRNVGVLGVLAWVSPTIEGYMTFFLLVSMIESLVLRAKLVAVLPSPPSRPRFSPDALRSVWRFAAGITATSLLALALTQLDKLVLTKMLPLSEFGQYMLAWTVVSILSVVVGPVSNAIFPRLTSLHVAGDQAALTSTYHKACQLMGILVIPSACTLAIFSPQILFVWGGDLDGGLGTVSTLASILSIGVMLNALMLPPYLLTLAHGWTRFAVLANLIAVVVIVPAMVFSANRFGAVGAASVFVALNFCYVVIGMHFLHRRLLPAEKWTWYRVDVFYPLLAAIAIMPLFYQLVSNIESRIGLVLAVGAAWLTAQLLVVVATPLGRETLANLRGRICAA